MATTTARKSTARKPSAQRASDEILQDTIDKGRQSILATRVLKLASGHKVRITIRSDSYRFQSSARAEVFNPTELKWNGLASIHYAAMQTPPGLVYASAPPAAWCFAADMASLLAQAKAILA